MFSKLQALVKYFIYRLTNQLEI